MIKFQLKLVAERFITISAENEEQLLKKVEQMETTELRTLAGYPEWEVESVSDMPDELEAELVLQDGKLWTSN